MTSQDFSPPPTDADAPPNSQNRTSPASKRSKARPTTLVLTQQWVEENKGEYIFMEGAQWWRYDSGCWSYSSTEHVKTSIQSFLTRLHEANPKVSVLPIEIQNVLFLAKGILGPHPHSDFNANKSWIGMKNGVYDTLTGTLLPHDPENRLTHQVPYDFDAEAVCPRWDRFLTEVMLRTDGTTHTEWIDLLQEWFGYCMIPDTSAQVSMFWTGEGANGKGTATRLMTKLVGEENCTDLDINRLDDPYFRADLVGILVAFVDEPDPHAMKKNGAYFKKLTGENIVNARRPTENVFRFKPMCRLTVTMNNLLSTEDISYGYFRRIVLIDWRRNGEKEVQDKKMDNVLAAELPGIFNWAMVGLARWRERGNDFIIPEESKQLNAEYRKSEDSVGGFMEEKVQEDAFGVVPAREVFQSYAEWCKGFGMKPWSNKLLGDRLKKSGYKNGNIRIAGVNCWGWSGFTLNGAQRTFVDEGL